jgi:GntR family transcriptional regulator
MSRVSRGRPEPLYYQVETALLQRISQREWRAGQQIPTEDELCQEYGVSRITVRQALRNLVDKGYLTRVSGKGTFVREPTLTAGRRGLRSFTDDMRALGLEGGAQLLSLETLPADPLVADKLQLPDGAAVYVIRRLRTGDELPVGLQTTHLPCARFPGLERADLNGSLYQQLRERYGVVAKEAREVFRVSAIGGEEARLLQTAEGACGFWVERVSRDRRGVFEYTRSLMRGDRFQVELHLHDQGGEDG